MMSNTVVEYKTTYQHTTHIIHHQLIFSTKQMKFLKPVLTIRAVKGNLVYKLLPGHYLKFSLYVWRSEVELGLYQVNINDENSINEIEVIREKFDSNYLDTIKRDENAPQPLRDFIEMRPSYHGAPYVISNNYNEYKDAMELVGKIKDYLGKLLVSEVS